jgi:hypothetical protein
MEQPGLHDRHRNKDGEISRKHGNTLIRTLRRVYGAPASPPGRGTMRSWRTCSPSSMSTRGASWSATMSVGSWEAGSPRLAQAPSPPSPRRAP